MTPITIEKIIDLLDAKLLSPQKNGLITGVRTDSRNIHPGDLYVSFVGSKVDGHHFIAQAKQNGAIAFLITHPVPELQDVQNLILVADALIAIQKLAAYERSQFSGPVIGITGSNGKTTTKEMVACVLQSQSPCLYTEANMNNELGMPLTILQRKPTHGSIVLEMGMRGRGQIAELCEIAKPTAGIITNIGQSHIELLGSQAAIADAKAELLDSIPPNGRAVLCKDDEWLPKIAHRCRGIVRWYGLDPTCDAWAENIQRSSSGVSFLAHVLGSSAIVQLPTFGIHNIRNALSALLIGHELGIPLYQMASQFMTLPISSGRLHIIDGNQKRKIIDDCYNASPLSMKASLEVLQEFSTHYSTIAILGDMYELGAFEQQGHIEVGMHTIKCNIELLITIGPRAKWISNTAKSAGQKCIHFDDVSDLMNHLEELIPSNAVVLVKASRGMHLERIVDKLQQLP